MQDVYDSPAWQEHLRNYLHTPYHLVFAVYVDWFNPLGNKAAGKTISCGAIVLYCMNLPLEIHFLPENTLIIGLMPAPNGATVWTIPYILEFFQKRVSAFHNGKQLATFNHPQGITVAA
ncbi:hypothetical protein GYMLUDRAFT_250223 [Collybiopsis luxurians FD-317 M1]|uniref:Uncharacterized protein n=1 Tax=Collybiopsis luxurians FD-317 M1 TaxID=944289 RepID=A0A0D0C6Y4_9AGAR|nr:hypothetical protein GYMLUDRAFT_250223 [Collybiopsis luxurians FD-317 M1]